MMVIFSASSDAMSSGNTSRIIGPIVRWLIPGISEPALRRVVFIVRKTAHVTEYAVLALLLWWAWHKTASRASERHSRAAPGTRLTAAWRWSEALIVLTFTFLYAGSDELHQYFVPTREARFGDVLLDTSGAALGLLFIWLVGRWRNCW